MKKVRILALVAVVTLLLANLASAQGISTLPGGGWWSGEQVQNVGNADATVNITAYDKDSGTSYSADETIGPGEAFTFTPFAGGGLDSLPDGFQGSAVVRADQPIKAIVNVTNLEVGDLGTAGGLAAAQYQGVDGSAVDTTLYFPLVKGDYYGATTTYYVQNAGESAATFTASFAMNDGNVYAYTTPLVDPNQIAVFSVFDATDYDNGTDTGGAVRLGALTVTSDEPMAGVVMEHSTTDADAAFLFGTRGFTANDFDMKAYAPVIKNDYYDQFTGLQVQNVSSSNIDITVTYKVAEGPNAGETITQRALGVEPGKSHTFVQLDAVDGGVGSNLDAGDLAGATVEATGNFVAIVSEQQMSGVANEVGITYSALPDGVATTKVSVPLFKDMYYNNTSGLQIQNVGDGEATATATFACTTEGGSTFTAETSNFNIAVGETYLFYAPSTATNPGGNLFDTGEFQSDSNCSVTIEADQDIVAIVNEMGAEGNVMDNNNYEGFNLE